MANRRMFSKRIIQSARFLKMPISSQALYFHLGLMADDDGIVEAFNALRIVGCTEDDLRVLEAKGFIKILNEELVSYIRDWNENNLIRPDRKIDSIYQDLLVEIMPNVQLIEKRQRSDVKHKIIDSECLIETHGQSTDGQWTVHGQTMDSPRTDNGQSMDGLGKVRLGKDKLGKDKLEEREKITFQQIAEMYNDTCVSFPRLTKLSDARKKAISARLKTYSVNDFKLLFEKAEASSFLKGKNQRNWTATFDWLVQDANMAKVLDGNYDNHVIAKLENKNNKFNNYPQREYDFNDLEKKLLDN